MSGKTSSDYDALFKELIRYKSIVREDTFKDKKANVSLEDEIAKRFRIYL